MMFSPSVHDFLYANPVISPQSEDGSEDYENSDRYGHGADGMNRRFPSADFLFLDQNDVIDRDLDNDGFHFYSLRMPQEAIPFNRGHDKPA